VVHSFVLAAIRPCEDSVAVHFVVAPLAVVFPAVRPCVDANAVDVILKEVSSISRPISP
jgi:hypothetical protein